MKYVLLVAVLLGGILVIDSLIPCEACAPNTVVPQLAAAPVVSNNSDLRSTCQQAPLFVENTPESTPIEVSRERWFPGKRILRAIQHRRDMRRGVVCDQ